LFRFLSGKLLFDLTMKQLKFNGILQELITKAINGNIQDVDFIMKHLSPQSSLAMTRYVDYALSLVENKQAINRVKHYLFNGTLIQRNYCSLYFNRRGDRKIVSLAYQQGLIDEIQAFAR